MKPASLIAAAVVVGTANVFALAHAWGNRSGPVEADVTLTQRELVEPYVMDDEDSGVGLNLRWSAGTGGMSYYPGRRLPWLDKRTLQELGFDTSVAPSDKSAGEFYSRQRPRRAFVALEYDGPAWRKWIDEFEHPAPGHLRQPTYIETANLREESTRLMAIDADSEAARLRARHPDKSSVIILPAVIRIGAEQQDSKTPAQLSGSIDEIPSSIHVPLPFSAQFPRLPLAVRNKARYRVHLRYGSSLEPWIVGVEFDAPGH